MAGSLSKIFSDDHRRLDELLLRAFADPGNVNEEAYTAFRAGILRHIAIEEKILLPALRKARPDNPLPFAAKIRLDHGAIAALLVPPPSKKIFALLRAVLADHNLLEERSDGLYREFDSMPETDVKRLMDDALNAPEVPLHPYNAAPYVLDATRRALARAGYDFDGY